MSEDIELTACKKRIHTDVVNCLKEIEKLVLEDYSRRKKAGELGLRTVVPWEMCHGNPALFLGNGPASLNLINGEDPKYYSLYLRKPLFEFKDSNGFSFTEILFQLISSKLMIYCNNKKIKFNSPQRETSRYSEFSKTCVTLIFFKERTLDMDPEIVLEYCLNLEPLAETAQGGSSSSKKPQLGSNPQIFIQENLFLCLHCTVPHVLNSVGDPVTRAMPVDFVSGFEEQSDMLGYFISNPIAIFRLIRLLMPSTKQQLSARLENALNLYSKKVLDSIMADTRLRDALQDEYRIIARSPHWKRGLDLLYQYGLFPVVEFYNEICERKSNYNSHMKVLQRCLASDAPHQQFGLSQDIECYRLFGFIMCLYGNWIRQSTVKRDFEGAVLSVLGKPKGDKFCRLLTDDNQLQIENKLLYTDEFLIQLVYEVTKCPHKELFIGNYDADSLRSVFKTQVRSREYEPRESAGPGQSSFCQANNTSLELLPLAEDAHLPRILVDDVNDSFRLPTEEILKLLNEKSTILKQESTQAITTAPVKTTTLILPRSNKTH